MQFIIFKSIKKKFCCYMDHQRSVASKLTVKYSFQCDLLRFYERKKNGNSNGAILDETVTPPLKKVQISMKVQTI